MVSLGEMRMKLAGMISVSRFNHSLGVEGASVALAKRYGEDEEKARIAGLIHDCARDLPKDMLLKMAGESDIVVDKVEILEPVLLHAPVGALLARLEFGLDDPDMLNAIRFHTTGSPDMSVLEKIVFLADYIEPARSFPGVETLRVEAEGNLERAVVMALDQTLLYLIGKRALIHPRTIEARNKMLCR